ncbi:MAG: iron-containing alcohol dehydrogenase family protein [Negativicutes bacterium]|nr:iron-containing alcohol dehydrogenase family protein [Negativicutes bacterium]
MQFCFHVPTRIYFGDGCVRQHMDEFSRWGKRAFIVTGRNSAKASGALADVVAVLDKQGIDWEIFDRIAENPSIEAVETAGVAAREFVPTMLVAIGGGSPLDAAKAIAALAVNNISADKLFDGGFTASPLPVLAVPITAGTGSEVTPYSILTDASRKTKRSFADPRIFPKAAFLDARYTQTQTREVTVNTAIDALSHAVEGYLSKRATPISDCLAVEAMRRFAGVKETLLTGSFSLSDREELLYSSLLSGVVLAQTGTTAVHALGYSLTYFRNVPHGRANGLLLAECLRFAKAAASEKVSVILRAVGVDTVEGLKDLMQRLLASDETYSDAELREFAALAMQTKNIANTPGDPTAGDLYHILRASLRVVQSE